MKVTKGEYCQFSLHGKMQLLNEFGELLGQKKIDNISIQFYRLCDFYVEVLMNVKNKELVKVEPIKNINQLLSVKRKA
jgi:hypothetical protein